MQTADLSTHGARVSWILTTTGLAQRALSKAAGLSDGFLGVFLKRHRDGAKPELDVASARGISAAIGCTASWLLFGEGDAPAEADIAAAGERIRAAASSLDALPATGTEG